MSQEVSPRLSHVGIYVTDLPKMIGFYTNVLGFVVSDAAPDGRITFLSRNPSDHHQVVLVPGRQTELATPMMQQISFNVGTLGNVQRAFRKVRALPGLEARQPRQRLVNLFSRPRRQSHRNVLRHPVVRLTALRF
jgi:catechol 2,3-dioxygenase-like lactoylglutathione lyase family enzyme